MFDARNRLAHVADGLGLLNLSATLRRNSPRLVILAYHRVLDIPDEQNFASDLELVSASTRGFREQMQFMARHFHMATFRELDEIRRAGLDLPRATAVVTFDDGFEDNFQNAFPILQELQVPATIFLSTGFIDRDEAFWFEALAQAVVGTARPISLPAWPGVRGDAPMAERRRALDQLFRYLKRLPDAERRSHVQHLISDSGLGERIAADTVSRPLKWSQVRAMAAAGIEFGSHTVDHPVLVHLSEAQIRAELGDSKRRIETELGSEIISLSYPVGGANAFDDRVRRIASEVGYRCAVSYQPGINSFRDADWFALHRAHVERYTSMQRFKAEVAIADLLP